MRSQFWTAPNQLTLLRLIFVPFVVINVLDGDFGWALILFVLAGISDALDGMLARVLKQKTTLGQYLDPIADKLLLSSLFLVLSATHYIPWKYTVLVFLRDICILIVAGLLYTTTTIRDFSPSIFGKINTFAQVAAVFFVLLYEYHSEHWIHTARQGFLYATFAFTVISGFHYIFQTGQKIHANGQNRPAASGR